jgi:hypothetical protein
MLLAPSHVTRLAAPPTQASEARTEADIGIIPRAARHLFRLASARDGEAETSVRVAFLEIVNDELRDLLHPATPARDIVVRERAGVIAVSGLREAPCADVDAVLRALARGVLARTTAATAMNATSSRSHALFTLLVERRRRAPAPGEPRTVCAKFHLVDLAGSERAKKSEATGARLREAAAINGGLLALGNVINSLGDAARRAPGAAHHVPYRDSKLTRLLQDSLGGNSRTAMVACVSTADSNLDETLNTLKYALRARAIRNRPTVNVDPAAAALASTREAGLPSEEEEGGERGAGGAELARLRGEAAAARRAADEAAEALASVRAERDAAQMELADVQRALEAAAAAAAGGTSPGAATADADAAAQEAARARARRTVELTWRLAAKEAALQRGEALLAEAQDELARDALIFRQKSDEAAALRRQLAEARAAAAAPGAAAGAPPAPAPALTPRRSVTGVPVQAPPPRDAAREAAHAAAAAARRLREQDFAISRKEELLAELARNATQAAALSARYSARLTSLQAETRAHRTSISTSSGGDAAAPAAAAAQSERSGWLADAAAQLELLSARMHDGAPAAGGRGRAATLEAQLAEMRAAREELRRSAAETEAAAVAAAAAAASAAPSAEPQQEQQQQQQPCQACPPVVPMPDWLRADLEALMAGAGAEEEAARAEAAAASAAAAREECAAEKAALELKVARAGAAAAAAAAGAAAAAAERHAGEAAAATAREAREAAFRVRAAAAARRSEGTGAWLSGQDAASLAEATDRLESLDDTVAVCSAAAARARATAAAAAGAAASLDAHAAAVADAAALRAALAAAARVAATAAATGCAEARRAADAEAAAAAAQAAAADAEAARAAAAREADAARVELERAHAEEVQQLLVTHAAAAAAGAVPSADEGAVSAALLRAEAARLAAEAAARRAAAQAEQLRAELAEQAAANDATEARAAAAEGLADSLMAELAALKAQAAAARA